ncbi:uncharacterized protein LOC114194744 isoform X1 [Vigna unguiculata]|uniref:uncharacterized protein LOC114194744 isoform X1 n=2 Tax=Vigna unguiculata TaxID=3917 RepID=UPI0010161805|nr:uncharacterized protein LOC114194744 isoform X1 [Vigna unguiculata]
MAEALLFEVWDADLSRGEGLQNNFSYASASFKMVEELPQLKPKNYMSAVSKASVKARSETQNVAKGVSFSPFLQVDVPGRKTQASENLWVDDSPNMPKKLYSDYGHTGRQSNKSVVGTNKYLENDIGVSFAKDSGGKKNLGFGIGQLVEYPSSIMRSVGGYDSCISVVHEKMHEANFESSLPSDTSVRANILHGSHNTSSHGLENYVNPQTSIPFKEILKAPPYHVSVSVSNQTPTLPQQQAINMDAYFVDENTRLLAMTQIPELSKQHHALHFNMNQKQGGSSSILKVQHYTCEASTSEQGSSCATLKLPQSSWIFGNHENTVGLEKLPSLTGMNGYYHLSDLSPTPLHSKEKESQCKHSSDLQNEETSLSLGISKDNIRSSAFEKYSEQPSNICVEGKYPCAALINCCQPLCKNIGQQFADVSGETSLKMPSDLCRNLNISKNGNIHFEQGGKILGQDSTIIGFHTPQWRDVPSKVRKAVCDATSLDQTSNGLDKEGQEGFQFGNISAKRSKRTTDMGDLSEEKENSNVSSGCSAPVITQASVMVNKIDYCTDDAIDTGFVNNLVVDEGSGIDQGSMSDLVESERTDESLGLISGNYLKNGCSRVLNDESCCDLLDDLKLLDSSIWKKERNQNHFVLSANCKTNQSQKVKRGIKGRK